MENRRHVLGPISNNRPLPFLESGPRLGGAAALYTAGGVGLRRWDRNPFSPLVPLRLAFSGLAEPFPNPRR
jgi:hypothetical protein